MAPYDVFLSFRDKDTRRGFTGYLYKALCDKGIHTFIDLHKKLYRGYQIAPSVSDAIENSRIIIVVLSKNYASSTYCLYELAKIVDLIEGKDQRVIPVFYDVDPSHLQLDDESGTYGKALARHHDRFKNDNHNVQKWRTALQQVANLSGWNFTHRRDAYEYEFIDKIVEDISRKIDPTPLHLADYLVGLDCRVLQLKRLLNSKSDDVYIIGIYGLGGIGKTTIARALFNNIANQFDDCCFLDDVRQNSMKLGLIYLQETLLSEIFGDNDIMLDSVSKGISILKERLCRKKVLLVLDDVDKLAQLQATVGGPDWFGPGSRIFITTRDKHLLATHGFDEIYGPKKLDDKEALELLSRRASQTSKLDPSLADKLNRAVTYASGLPLALEILGSHLFGKRIEEWEFALDPYERIPNKDIQNILKVSFDALDEYKQSVCLDIACCFKGYKLAEVEDILGAHYGACIKCDIRVLVDKCLLKIEENCVKMHDLIADMGREIVRLESPENPGRRSRLWFPKDIVQVLEENMGTDEIQIINLDFAKLEEETVGWDGAAFRKMKNLRILIIRNGRFSKGPTHLPNSLRVLEWWEYPSQSLPSNFHPDKLAIVRLPFSGSKLFELDNLLKKFVNLRALNFDECQYITHIPDVSDIPNLEELSFAYCENLTEIHELVGFLGRLRFMDAMGCSKLRTFPPINLACLEHLTLSHCLSLESFPEILGKMKNIKQLTLEYTAIKELPFSIQNLSQLQTLTLNSCGMLQLPSSIAMLPELEKLSVSRCEGLQSSKLDNNEEKVSSIVYSNAKHVYFTACNMSDEFILIGLNWFANVKELDLSSNNFTILPSYLNERRFLKKLNLDYCMHLREITGVPPNLETLSAKWCTSLKYLDLTVHLASTKECRFLRELILDDCEGLQEIRGIPPNIELLSARNCRSLTSSCRSMLLNQELHEAGNKRFCFPGTRIPEWFEHHSRGGSISFWFRNKFPAISLCMVGLMHKHPISFGLIVIINGHKMKTDFLTIKRFFLESPAVTDHILIFGKKWIKFEDNLEEVLAEKEWNHVVVSIDIEFKWDPKELVVMRTGFHVIKQNSTMDNVRFTNPYNHRFLKEI